MKNLDKYGMNPAVTNFVRNELSKDLSVSARAIFEKAQKIFKDEGFTVIDVSDVVYHLSAEMKVTFEQVKKFIVSKYKHERLYGHSDKHKGDRVVRMYLDDVFKKGNSIISKHESNTGVVVSFTAQDIINFSS